MLSTWHGLIVIGKIALPNAFAWAISTKHHREAIELGLHRTTTARCSLRFRYSSRPSHALP